MKNIHSKKGGMRYQAEIRNISIHNYQHYLRCHGMLLFIFYCQGRRYLY